MNKEILIAVDDSIHAKLAIKYASSLDCVINDLSFVLFHIQPTISDYVIGEANQSTDAYRKLKEKERKNGNDAEKLLEKFKGHMLDLGIDDTRIKTVSHRKNSGIAKDILEMALAGNYDAVVVGRKGRSKIEEMIFGNVARKLLEHSEVTPVWVIDDNIDSSNILIAVDGSEGSLRAVDHIAFMFSDNPETKITLLHAIPKFGEYNPIDFNESDEELKDLMIRGDEKRIDRFFDHAMHTFHKAGIDKKQLNIKTVSCGINTGKAIVNEIRKGNFKTVVLGRNGASNSFFFGSVSRYIIDKTENRTIWLVP